MHLLRGLGALTLLPDTVAAVSFFSSYVDGAGVTVGEPLPQSPGNFTSAPPRTSREQSSFLTDNQQQEEPTIFFSLAATSASASTTAAPGELRRDLEPRQRTRTRSRVSPPPGADPSPSSSNPLDGIIWLTSTRDEPDGEPGTPTRTREPFVGDRPRTRSRASELLPSATSANLDPSARELITVDSVATSGNACPNDTVSVSLSLNRDVVTFGFDDFHLGVGVQYRPEDQFKECSVLLNLLYPPGYTYSVLDSTYHGFSNLLAGMGTSIDAEYIFIDGQGNAYFGPVTDPNTGEDVGQGSAVTNSRIEGQAGNEEGHSFMVTEQVPLSQRLASPCQGEDATLLIRTKWTLEAPDGSEGETRAEDLTFALSQQLHLAWEEC